MADAVLRRIAIALRVCWAMGPNWTLSRTLGFIYAKTRHLERRLPSTTWTELDRDLGESVRLEGLVWPVDRDAARAFHQSFPDPELGSKISDLRQGRLGIFGGQVNDFGWPPRWHNNYDNETKIPANQHFSRISTFKFGDIKNIWEQGRFEFVWLLTRGHFSGQMDDAASLFFEVVSDFTDQNPPFDGPHWMCGQESALRALMILAGWSAFSNIASEHDRRLVLCLMVATARRIDAHINYALSQNNNHGLSEAMGLFVIGLAVDGLPESESWIEKGKTILESEAERLVDQHGGFSQQSANYHRVMMHILIAAIAIGKKHNQHLPKCTAAIRRATSFLNTLIVSDGRQPRYGHDDGACILDWTACDYSDFRPALQEGYFVTENARRLEPGPWDAGLYWLGNLKSNDQGNSHPLARDSQPRVFKKSGIAVLRSGQRYASMRIPDGKTRPGQADALHVDIWFNGENIAIDSGSYRYNATGDWASIPLAEGRLHSGITSAEHDLATRVGRFLFLPWPAVRVRDEQSNESRLSAVFQHSIGRISQWTRTVELRDDAIFVTDNLQCLADCPVRLRWQLCDGELESDSTTSFCLSTSNGKFKIDIQSEGFKDTPKVTNIRASESVDGWYAPRYGLLAPCNSLLVDGMTVNHPQEVVLTSRFRSIDRE